MAKDDDAAAKAALEAAFRYMQSQYVSLYTAGGGAGSSFSPGGGSSAVTYSSGASYAGGGGGLVYAAGGNGAAVPVPGCPCNLCQGRQMPTTGMGGFSEKGTEDFAAGTVTGYRWWSLPAPDFRRHPLTADEHWPRSLLSGMKAAWQPGVNEAVCLAGHPHKEPLPALACGCGFWSFTNLTYYNLGTGGLPVAGVIEGWGRTRIGELGFRCAKAKIVALCPQFTITPYGSYDGWSDAPVVSRPVTQEEEDHMESWMAVIGIRLEDTYPGVRVFPDTKAMLAEFPLASLSWTLPGWFDSISAVRFRRFDRLSGDTPGVAGRAPESPARALAAPQGVHG